MTDFRLPIFVLHTDYMKVQERIKFNSMKAQN
jgi:hypothetical protein